MAWAAATQFIVVHHSTALSFINFVILVQTALLFVGPQHKVGGGGQHVIQRAQALCHKQGDLLEGLP